MLRGEYTERGHLLYENEGKDEACVDRLDLTSMDTFSVQVQLFKAKVPVRANHVNVLCRDRWYHNARDHYY